ncbi:hypothetical protein U9M48_039837 [Paspalum notatum var. saurae]|uniref:Uncharacterized protein n=1 Tax=Paspalum notatum var. saurae TaxID=547442 RepID=A0AAQ3UKE6_PASNO
MSRVLPSHSSPCAARIVRIVHAKLTRSFIQNSEPEHQEDDPEDPEYLPEENTDEQDSGDDEPDNIVTRDDWYED